MKKIYLLIAMTAIMSIFITHATSLEHKVSNFDKYERYFDSLDNTERGNYCLIQPGLYNILKQMPKEAGKPMLYKDIVPGPGAYPSIFGVNLTPDQLERMDTLKYNHQCDTLLCQNMSNWVEGWAECRIISTLDTISVFDICSKYVFFTHDYVKDTIYDSKFKSVFIDLVKNWDETKISKACITDHVSEYSICISRLIIKNGRLIDIKYKKCSSLYLDQIYAR